MIKERFAFVAEQIQSGAIVVVSRDQNNLVELRVPKYMLVQLTAEDLIQGIHGRFISNFSKRVHYEVIGESNSNVNILIQL